jgi:hypothetical protein
MKIGLINLALTLYKNGIFSDVKSILDMGSKELRISYNDLKYSLDQANIKITNKNFDILKKFPKGKRISTKHFWSLLKINDLKCIDINKSHNSIYLDLNYPLDDKKLMSKFDLVNDFGNNEHVFNVGEAYKTMYGLCKRGGLIWINQSVFGGNGFFHYDQSFFEGFAAANSLSILHMSYVVNVGPYKQFVIPCDKDLLSKFDLNKLESLDISCIFRKNTNKKFSYYYQYNANNNRKPFIPIFINSKYPPEKLYIPTKSKKELINDAKKGDEVAVEWLRTMGFKI